MSAEPPTHDTRVVIFTFLMPAPWASPLHFCACTPRGRCVRVWLTTGRTRRGSSGHWHRQQRSLCLSLLAPLSNPVQPWRPPPPYQPPPAAGPASSAGPPGPACSRGWSRLRSPPPHRWPGPTPAPRSGAAAAPGSLAAAEAVRESRAAEAAAVGRQADVSCGSAFRRSRQGQSHALSSDSRSRPAQQPHLIVLVAQALGRPPQRIQAACCRSKGGWGICGWLVGRAAAAPLLLDARPPALRASPEAQKTLLRL